MAHKDVEYHVGQAGGGKASITADVFGDFNEAAGRAFALAASGAEDVKLDVCIWSEAGAKAYGGDDAVKQYQEDPDASVFERFEVKVTSKGRVS